LADTSFPAHITVDRVVDLDGVPILTATVTLEEDAAELPLPAGPEGPPGPQGRPQTTFLKVGEIANEAARPAGLTADDRGKWWHRLDDDGMDVWDGTQWRHSPGAVGVQGPIAATNSITVTDTVHDENLTAAGVEFTGAGAAQELKVTVPAGLAGATGPAGASGVITESPDYDPAFGASERSPFAWNNASRKFRAVSPTNGYGPWSWYNTDFVANTESAVDKIVCGTFTIPGLAFQWRPIVYGNMSCYISSDTGFFRANVRLFSSEGVVVSGYRSKIGVGAYQYVTLAPLYADDETTRTVSPTSTFAVVPAGEEAKLVATVERLGSNFNSADPIGFNRTAASIVVYAQPV
jgi:hypothetical protein